MGIVQSILYWMTNLKYFCFTKPFIIFYTYTTPNYTPLSSITLFLVFMLDATNNFLDSCLWFTCLTKAFRFSVHCHIWQTKTNHHRCLAFLFENSKQIIIHIETSLYWKIHLLQLILKVGYIQLLFILHLYLVQTLYVGLFFTLLYY